MFAHVGLVSPKAWEAGLASLAVPLAISDMSLAQWCQNAAASCADRSSSLTWLLRPWTPPPPHPRHTTSAGPDLLPVLEGTSLGVGP